MFCSPQERRDSHWHVLRCLGAAREMPCGRCNCTSICELTLVNVPCREPPAGHPSLHQPSADSPVGTIQWLPCCCASSILQNCGQQSLRVLACLGFPSHCTAHRQPQTSNLSAVSIWTSTPQHRAEAPPLPDPAAHAKRRSAWPASPSPLARAPAQLPAARSRRRSRRRQS